jgi:pimeloyl-ACP methyl ester carboxylesterase
MAALLEDAGRRVIGVDLLGHGDAPKPHDPEAYADLTTRVLDVMPDEPVALVGFSLGAMTSLELTRQHPERVSRLVVAGIGANLFQDDPARGQAIVDAVEGRGDSGNVAAQRFAAYANEDGNDPLALAACLKRRRGGPWKPADLAPITCPTLVVLGDKDFAGPADPLVDALVNSRLVILKNTDHFATPESFAFIDATLEFLEALPA